jgi:hypothetical protein
MSPAGNWSGILKNVLRTASELLTSSALLLYGVIDLHIDGIGSINSSALKIACPPPGIGAETSGNFSEQRWNTYITGIVAQEGAVANLHIGTATIPCATGINSSALGVARPPPGIGAKKLRKAMRPAWNYLH